MNQILSVEMPKNGKPKHKASVNSIVIVFAIILMIFGIGTLSTGVYAYSKNRAKKANNGLEVSKNSKPIITVERIDANNINIVATHDKEISYITYAFNGEEEKKIEGSGKKEISVQVELPIGESTLTIEAKDINGITASYSPKDLFKVEQKPTIKLEQVEDKIQVTTESTINIDKVSYYWDDDIENAKEYTINDVKNVTLIDALAGSHTLNIIAVDVEGNETKIDKSILGVHKPVVDVTTDGNKFYIKASDEEGLTKIEIKLNSNEKIVEEINGNEYEKEIVLEDGLNKLTVKVYNKHEKDTTSKVKYTKE